MAGSGLPVSGERIHPAHMKFLHFLAACLFFASVSCEQHDWEETKQLHETHGHEEGHGGDEAH